METKEHFHGAEGAAKRPHRQGKKRALPMNRGHKPAPKPKHGMSRRQRGMMHKGMNPGGGMVKTY